MQEGPYAQRPVPPRVYPQGPPLEHALVTAQGSGAAGSARPNTTSNQGSGGQRPQNGGVGNGEHLASWFDSHRNLPLAQQQSALEQERGFRQLRPEVQQRMHDRLTQLNQMSPDQRARVLARTEALERLTPEQRAQVRGTMQQLGTLPPGRKQAVSQAFRQLRNLPPNVQQSYLNSPEMRSQFSDGERGTINNLLNVAPYLPPPNPPAPQR